MVVFTLSRVICVEYKNNRKIILWYASCAAPLVLMVC